MGSNRFNKPSPPQYAPKEVKKVEEPTVALLPCCVCKKTITTGYYGRHNEGGTCCKKCEDAFVQGEHHEITTRVTTFFGSIYRPR